MSIKTFKSAWPSHPRRINVQETEPGPNVYISDPVWDDKKGITLAPSDAPALALAILEAAGVEPDREPLECQVSLGTIVADLQDTIKHVEALADAARERAELEAEALELFNVNQGINLPDWGKADRAVISSWVRVARRARELAKEATK